MNDEHVFEPKISLLEIILIGVLFALLDLIGFALIFFALDDFGILEMVASPIFLYLSIKGIPAMRQLICWVLELIPWVGDILPLFTVGWILTVWADRHPSGLAAKTVSVVQTARGRRVPGAGAQAAAGAASLRRIEQAEERATQSMERVSRTPGATNLRAAPNTERPRIIESSKQGGLARDGLSNRPAAKLAEEIYEEGNPMREIRNLFTAPPQPPNKQEKTVKVDDNGTVDLRKAA